MSVILPTLLSALLLAPAPRPESPAGTETVLLLRYALLAGGRGASPGPAVAGALGSAELQESLLQWDPDADNDEVRRVFALNHIVEVARQASQLPATGGNANGVFTYGESRFDVQLAVKPGPNGADVTAEIRHDGALVSAPRVRTPFGQRAIVSSEDGPEAPLLFLVLDLRQVSAEELKRKGMRFAWKPDVALIDGERIQAPKVAHRVNPAYPEAAKSARTEGVVVLRTLIDTDGTIADVEIVQGQPDGLSEAAIEAVRQWRFEPALLEGKAVKVVFMLTINFVLPEEDEQS